MLPPTDGSGGKDAGKAVWRAVPEYGNEDIFYTNTSPSTSGSNSIDIYYGVSANTALPSGTYSNTVVYTAIVDGGVNAEGEEGASISPASQDVLDSGQEVTIATSLYPGLSLNNLGDITVKIGDNDCTDIAPVLTEIGSLNLICKAPAQTSYGKYTVTATISKYSKTYTLTDVYEYYLVPATMQEFYSEYCDRMSANQIINLRDTRDNNTYDVKKLPDGKCWMVQNLRLVGPRTLTPSDSNVGANFALPNTVTSFTPYDSCANTAQVYNTNNTTYGAYYSWYALTAGSSNCSTTGGITAPYDVCPKGWRLPTGSPTNEFSVLALAYGGTGDNNDTIAYPSIVGDYHTSDYAGFALSGTIYAYHIENQGVRAVYWTSTTYPGISTDGMSMHIRSDVSGGIAGPYGSLSKGRGATARCIAK